MELAYNTDITLASPQNTWSLARPSPQKIIQVHLHLPQTFQIHLHPSPQEKLSKLVYTTHQILESEVPPSPGPLGVF